MIEDIAAAIRSRRFRYVDEDRLQRGIAAALIADGFTVEREHRLDRWNRLDMLVDGRIGVEVKIAGSRAEVRRQIERYLRHDIEGVVLVTSRSSHVRVPALLRGKPVEVVCLNGAGL
jgi:alkanesulfonate monooxygenase SsuD/methylene tetrahydromethanopterin reductase-like flavin-dependent oxidoreductase (luciferase family)